MLKMALGTFVSAQVTARQPSVGLLGIVFCGLDGLVDNFENVWSDETPLAQHPDTGAVPIQDITVQHELLQLYLGQLHQPLDLVLRSVVVFNAEGVDCDGLDAALVTYLEHLEADGVR
jgi:hypothetical protein